LAEACPPLAVLLAHELIWIDLIHGMIELGRLIGGADCSSSSFGMSRADAEIRFLSASQFHVRASCFHLKQGCIVF